MEEASANSGQAGFLFSKAKGGGVCGRLFLARVPPLLPAAQAEQGLLEGEDRGEPEKGSIGKRTAKKAGLEGDENQRVPAKTCRPSRCED